MIERFFNAANKELKEFLGRTSKQKAGVRGWVGLQEKMWNDPNIKQVVCNGCGMCIKQEKPTPIKRSVFDKDKPPDWLLANICSGFNEHGEEVSNIDCVFHPDFQLTSDNRVKE